MLKNPTRGRLKLLVTVPQIMMTAKRRGALLP